MYMYTETRDTNEINKVQGLLVKVYMLHHVHTRLRWKGF